MKGRVGRFAALLSLGALAAALIFALVLAIESVQSEQRAEQAVRTASQGVRDVLREIESVGAEAAGKTFAATEAGARRAEILNESADAVRAATAGADYADIAVELTALAVFDLSRRSQGPAEVLAAVGADQAADQAAAFAEAEDGKRLMRAARRARPHGGAPALSADTKASPGAPAYWYIWPDLEKGRAFAIRFSIIVKSPSAPTLELLTAAESRLRHDDGAYDDVDEYEERAFSGKVVVAFVESAQLSWTNPSALSLICALLAGVATSVGAHRLFAADGARDEEVKVREEEITRGIEEKQKALEASEARFRHLAESTNVTPWTADLDSQRFTYIGPQIEGLSGYPASQWMVAGFWADHIHPADRKRVLFEEIPKIPLDHYHTIEYRVRAADGKILSIRNMLTVVQETHRYRGATTTRTLAQGFFLDITELKHAAAALEVAREKAEEANRVKSEFLANMSHELRTPLNAVIGFSEIMKDELFGPLDAQYREYANSIHTSGRHLLDLINDVLDLSKIEAGRFELAEDESDVRGLLNECSVLLQERMRAAGLHGRYDISDDLPAMRIDERRVKQVILNLLSNAIKFTPPGGTVTLNAITHGEDGVMVSVRDTGIGMSPEEIPRALAKFGQIDGDLSRAHDGTGLGLPIAKSLIEMHGGRLEVYSEKGKGTEMRIWLPASRVVNRAA